MAYAEQAGEQASVEASPPLGAEDLDEGVARVSVRPRRRILAGLQLIEKSKRKVS